MLALRRFQLWASILKWAKSPLLTISSMASEGQQDLMIRFRPQPDQTPILPFLEQKYG